MSEPDYRTTYPVSICGTHLHKRGALEGLQTPFEIRMVDQEQCERWLAGVRLNEARGALCTTVVFCFVKDAYTGKTLKVLT